MAEGFALPTLEWPSFMLWGAVSVTILRLSSASLSLAWIYVLLLMRGVAAPGEDGGGFGGSFSLFSRRAQKVLSQNLSSLTHKRDFSYEQDSRIPPWTKSILVTLGRGGTLSQMPVMWGHPKEINYMELMNHFRHERSGCM